MRLAHILPTLALAIALGGCMHAANDANAPADPHAALTTAGDWQLVQATHADGRRIDALFPPRSSLRLRFAGHRLAVSGGCNGMGGTYALRDGVLTTGEMASTLMACDPPLMEADAEIARLFSTPLQLRWGAGGKRFSLHDKAGVTLLFEAMAQR